MSTLICNSCGAPLNASDELCPSCGAALRSRRKSAVTYFILGLLVVAIIVRALEMAETGAHGMSTFSPF